MIVIYRNKLNHDDRLMFDAHNKTEERERLRELARVNKRNPHDFELDPLYAGDRYVQHH